jgi:preprotein translocase subunit SecF
MNKRRLHHIWTKFRAVKPWYFLALALISGAVCVTALRANNQHMIKLRDAVYAADKDGADVQKPLRGLQDYVTHHMNTNLSAGNTSVYPPIQLKYTYERLVQAAGKADPASSQVYSQAQAYCEQQNSTDFSGRNRVPCIEEYVQSHGGTNAPAAGVPAELYKFDFVSPKWSSDLAGWSLLVFIFSCLLFVISFVTNRWLKRYAN